MNTRFIFTTGALCSVVLLGCSSNSTHTQREAAMGATAGAVIGGLVGSESGDALEGAAVGAAAGGAIGAAHGSSRDRDDNERSVSVRRDYDDNDFSDRDYRRLLTEEEEEILEARAESSGERNYELTDFLTGQEKENLRRRARLQDREIGDL